MTVEIAVTLLFVAAALYLFVRELLPIEVTALGLLAAMLMLRFVTPEQALSGFSNKAVIAIGGLFLLSHALMKTGLLDLAADRLVGSVGARRWLGVALLLAAVSLLSAFLNNTAIVALFIPLTLQLCARLEISPSKVLIPLSYASIFGGTLTLIGTSTNLLVSSVTETALERPLGVFEFTPLGLVFTVLGLAYILAFAPRRLPDRAAVGALTQKYQLAEYLTELRVVDDSRLVGRTLQQEDVASEYQTTVLAILRGDRRFIHDIGGMPLQENDVLIAEGKVEDLLRLRKEQGLALLPDVKMTDEELASGGLVMAEGWIDRNSRLVGRTLAAVDFRTRYGGFVLAIRRVGAMVRERIAHTPLRFSDSVLMLIPRDRLEELQTSEDFIVLSELPLRLRRERRWWLVILLLPGVVALAALGVVDIAVGAFLAAVLLLATRVLTPQEGYRAVDWSVIFLIAAFVPVGQAIVETGTAAFIASGLLALVELTPPELAPYATLSLVYLMTSLLTQMVSNNAAAIIVAPIALSLGASLGVDPRPFVMAVCYAASAEFMTPMGYQTNMMVYGAGAYRFLDYTRFGAPLNLLFWLVATLLIPRIWPF